MINKWSLIFFNNGGGIVTAKSTELFNNFGKRARLKIPLTMSSMRVNFLGVKYS